MKLLCRDMSYEGWAGMILSRGLRERSILACKELTSDRNEYCTRALSGSERRELNVEKSVTVI